MVNVCVAGELLCGAVWRDLCFFVCVSECVCVLGLWFTLRCCAACGFLCCVVFACLLGKRLRLCGLLVMYCVTLYGLYLLCFRVFVCYLCVAWFVIV